MELKYEIIIFILGLFSTFMYKEIKERWFSSNDKSKELEKVKEKKESMSATESSAILKFLDEVLERKYQYYLMNDILPYFMSDKDLEKAEIKRIKNEFYMDIYGSLSTVQKKQVKKIFTDQGSTMYVHQTFLKFLNESNIKYKQNNTMSRQTLNAIYDQGDNK